MVNKYLWELYLKAGGTEICTFFEKGLSDDCSMEYVEGLRRMQEEYCISKYILDDTQMQFEEIVIPALKNYKESMKAEGKTVKVFNEKKVSKKLAMEIIDGFLMDCWDESLELKGSEKSAYIYEISTIAALSTLNTIDFPGLFVPYYFQCNFNVLESIANTFDIQLPKVPVKSDYKGRFLYYGELCKVFYDFRKENKWTPYELCAFLYDFAPKYIGGIDSYIEKDLPEPKSAFFIGGDGRNMDATAEDDEDAVLFWQCDPDIRAGDMLVMCIKSPISAITSVWRCCSTGFNDPFFWYYRCSYICKPQKVKRFGLERIKKDRILSKMSIVKKNLQGINGVELRPSEYNHILDITKGTDIKRLEYAMDVSEDECVNEREVENKLIKPLLKKLGYTEEEYTQQLKIPIGNHNNLLIPDFVLLPQMKRGFQTAFAIIEAKRSITTKKELKAALEQARSYALQLGVKYSVVFSQEKIWVTTDQDNYAKVVKEFDCGKLKSSDTMQEIRHLLQKQA